MAARYRIKHCTEAGSYLVYNTGSLFFAFHYGHDKDLSQLTAHRAAINCAALLNAAADGAAIEQREHVHRCLVDLLPESYSAMLDLLSQFIPAPRKCSKI